MKTLRQGIGFIGSLAGKDNRQVVELKEEL